MNDNIPTGYDIDDQYCQWVECPICEDEWKGTVCQCDCENISKLEN